MKNLDLWKPGEIVLIDDTVPKLYDYFYDKSLTLISSTRDFETLEQYHEKIQVNVRDYHFCTIDGLSRWDIG